MKSSEFPLLADFLYEAIYTPSGVKRPDKKLILKPQLAHYYKNFGKDGDVCLVAEQSGKVIGAAWTRLLKGYGYFDERTPELSVSVVPNQRGRGVGTQLLTQLLEIVKRQGYLTVSLSVSQENPALRLYQRLGFEKVEARENDYLMVKYLQT